MEKASEDQMRNPLPWIAVVAIPLLIFTGFWGFSIRFFSIFLTSSVLVFSTLLLSSSKNKPQLQVEEAEVLIRPHHQQSYVVLKPQPESQKQETQESQQQDLDHFLVSSEDDNVDDGTTDWSDGSISDDESLFEIELPSCHYDSTNLINQYQPRKLPLESIFQQHNLMELLAEINEMSIIEEDNLIEIDISMGSIKCSRFEIEAS